MDHLVSELIVSANRDRTSIPPALTSSDPTSFAWGVIHRRHPLLIEQVSVAHPYGPAQTAALKALAVEMTDGVVRSLDPDAHDGAAWACWGEGRVGRRWDEVPFLWAESYFYRRLLAAVEFFSPGPWFWVDPFAHQKDAELADPALEVELAALDHLADLGAGERGNALLLSALWGNRADLGFAAQAGRPERGFSQGLVVDDSARLWSTVAGGGGTVCVVADNAGRELLADLMLVDELVSAGWAREVAIHVKPVPYYVSDATAGDVAACLRRLASAGGYAAAAARRLHEAFGNGRVRLRTSWFYVAPLEFDAMPADLAAEFGRARLTLMKGDLNYRRVFGDCHWTPTTDPSLAGSYFPGPFAVLRTLKSEVVLGVPQRDLARLDSEHPQWRVSGTHAMIQVVA